MIEMYKDHFEAQRYLNTIIASFKRTPHQFSFYRKWGLNTTVLHIYLLLN